MGIDPYNRYNHSLNIQESIGTPTPKMGVHLGVWKFIPSHSFTLLEHEMRLLNFTLGPHLHKPLLWSQALTYIASPRLAL
jgi:hypothetical protein